MKRSELVLTIAGLVATYCLPWPQGEEMPERRQVAQAIEAGGTGVRIRFYEIFGRVRTGPSEGIQPTR